MGEKMQRLSLTNLHQFRMIDEINNGYIELDNNYKLQQKLEQMGGELPLEPVINMNFCATENLVVKCQQTGAFFKASN